MDAFGRSCGIPVCLWKSKRDQVSQGREIRMLDPSEGAGRLECGPRQPGQPEAGCRDPVLVQLFRQTAPIFGKFCRGPTSL
jgi:hypothetical protein